MADDYYDLGEFTRPVMTSSVDAQAWFDRGLIWRYAFNHEAALQCFQEALSHDAQCAMALWGVAYAHGPFYNRPWADFTPAERAVAVSLAHEAIMAASASNHGSAPVERALIEAMARRYPEDTAYDLVQLQSWEDDYAAAMRTVHAEFPDDLDISALFAEAMMNRTPWQLWNLSSGEPAEGADTAEVVEVLEHAMAADVGESPHPAVRHLYIHALEMSPHPERALRAADELGVSSPDAGHFSHMPSHIYVQCGLYHEALAANDQAIRADRKYEEREGVDNFYTLSRCHDHHFKAYAAMFLGQYQPALEAGIAIQRTIPTALLRERAPMAEWLEAFVPMKAHVQVRFGRWRELVDEPLPDEPDVYPVTTATLHYAKGVAHAVLGHLGEADDALRDFAEAFAKVPPTRMFFTNRCVDILAIADEMLRGEVAYRKGDVDSAFTHLRTAVEHNENLPYDEPWAWMQPPRHALGALLLEQGNLDEAMDVYSADLGLDTAAARTHRRATAHPDNVWGLLGYVECLHRLGRHADAAAAQPRLDVALARADPEIHASCFCRLGE